MSVCVRHIFSISLGTLPLYSLELAHPGGIKVMS